MAAINFIICPVFIPDNCKHVFEVVRGIEIPRIITQKEIEDIIGDGFWDSSFSFITLGT